MRETNYDKSRTKNFFVYIYIGTKPHYFCQRDSNHLLTHTRWVSCLTSGVLISQVELLS